ncbi:MAG TPA: alpha/beta hydrolase family protein [Candidatus Limiplasma sp.]|nr:alpha/beta hydrolase family protein [Candidatus Limiplasma sp.]
MSFIQMQLHSECLTRKAEINVILPEMSDERRLDNGKYPVLWLLHGATDDQTMWQRFTSLELYAQKRGIAVVMPAVDISFYANIDAGRYFDYVTQELPRMLQSYFPLSEKREDNFIAGMSMGGHGTMKLGFTRPELYAAMGIFSCANFIDLMGSGNMLPGGRRVPLNFVRWLVFGTDDGDLTKCHNTEHDNRYLARLASESGKPLPKIFGCCGTQDGCHDSEKADLDYFRSLPNPFEVVFFDSVGIHYFDFWDEWLKVFIQWLPIRKRTKEIL